MVKRLHRDVRQRKVAPIADFPPSPRNGEVRPTAADADHLHRHQGAQRVELGDRLPAQDFGDTIEVHAEKALDLLSRRECTPPPVTCLETPRDGPMRRASAPPRAEAQSRGKSLNPPNRDAAPQASRRWANRGVLAERLGAGVLALGINCANQVGSHFRRYRLSKSPCPPLRVASIRSPMRLRSRNCRKDSRCLRFRAAAVRQIEAPAPHWYPRERA